MTLKHSLIAVALGLTTSLAGAGAFTTTASAQDTVGTKCAAAYTMRDADRAMQASLAEDGQPTAALHWRDAADAAQDYIDLHC
jgi:hypothetical protein